MGDYQEHEKIKYSGDETDLCKLDKFIHDDSNKE